MKSEKHLRVDSVRPKGRPQRKSGENQSQNRNNCGRGGCPRNKRRCHQLKDMDINDLKQYLLDTEYDSK